MDENFGQAEIDDGGAGSLVQVRCSEENPLSRGSQALIFDYDPVREVFKVVPLTIKEADAGATEKMGLAQASVVREKGQAEAQALQEKADAIKALDDAGRGHEEYRLKLDNERAIALQDIDARRQIAEAQARILAEALKNADIDIVGGESVFFDKLVNAISMGKSVDGFIGKSQTVSHVLEDYLSGKKDFPEDLKEMLGRLSQSSGSLQELTLSALLGKLALSGGKDKKDKIEQLRKAARQLGLDDLKV